MQKIIARFRLSGAALFVAILLAQGCSLAPAPTTDTGNYAALVPGRQPDNYSKLKPMLKPVSTGKASWYGPGFRGKKTASGDVFDDAKFTAAHKFLPLGSKARVTNLSNGKWVEVEINDRGPFVEDRVIDLSQAAANALGMVERGIARVRVELITGESGVRVGSVE